jgi:hypothetical protein
MADERTKTDNPDPDVETGADSAPADGATEDRASVPGRPRPPSPWRAATRST